MPRCRAGTLAPGAALVHDEEQLGAGVVGAVQRDNVAVLHLREDGQLALDADVLRPRRRLVNHLPRWQPAPTPRQGVVSATWPGDQRYAGPSGATLSATLLPVALSRQSRTSEKAPLSPRADTATCGERRVFSAARHALGLRAQRGRTGPGGRRSRSRPGTAGLAHCSRRARMAATPWCRRVIAVGGRLLAAGESLTSTQDNGGAARHVRVLSRCASRHFAQPAARPGRSPWRTRIRRAPPRLRHCPQWPRPHAQAQPSARGRY